MASAASPSSPPQPAQRGPWHQHLSVRLALLGALAVGTAVACTLSVLVVQAERNMLTQRQALEGVEAERMASLLNERVQQTVRQLEVAAEHMPEEAGLDPARLQAVLGQRPLLLAAFDSVFVVGADGRLRVIHDERGFSTTELRVADRDYFREVMAHHAPAISAPVMGRVSGEPIVVFAVPLQRGGRVWGVLGGSIRLRSHVLLSGLTSPGNTAAEEATTAGPEMVLTDARGNIVWHPDQHLIGRPVSDEPRLLPPMTQWAQQGGPVEPKARVHRDSETLSTHAGLPRPEWLVWRLLPQQDVLLPLKQGRWRAAQAGVAITLALTMCLWACMWWLFRPLSLLQSRSARLFDPDLGPSSGWPEAIGEVGDLSRALQQALRNKHAQDAQNQAMARQLSSVLEAAPIPILLTRERRFELVSPAAARLLGRPAAALLHQPASVIFASNLQYDQLGQRVAQAFEQQKEFEADMEFLRGDGNLFWGRLVGRPVQWGDMREGTLWTLADISAERREREALQWSANHDALTGLANRAALMRQLEEQVAAPGQEPSSLLLMDLDRFKAINDQHGHAAGDAMLRAVAQAMLGVVRGGDLVARLGGDEFAVLLPRCAADAALRVADAICDAVMQQQVDWNGHSLSVGISVGVALRPEQGAEAAAWMAAADAACYAAKGAGRGRATLSAEGTCASGSAGVVGAALRLVKA